MKTYDTKKRSGRARTGSLDDAGTWPSGALRFRCRVRLADGGKSETFFAPEGMAKDAARTWLAGVQAEEDSQHGFLAKKTNAARAKAATSGEPHAFETTDAWFARHVALKQCGETHRRIALSYWGKWVAPHIGRLDVRSLTRDNIETVRDALDVGMRTNLLAPATAANVWSILTSAMKAANASKDRSLRVHDAPLTYGILPPDRGESRDRPWLYPNEWVKVARCEAIPLPWRKTYALALYLGLRPSELRVLTWNDVDFDARVVHVTKSYDLGTGEVKDPKTRQGRRAVPIQPELLPYLEASKGDASALVAPIRDDQWENAARTFRAHLLVAGVTRSRLTAFTATEEPIDFRSLRDTCATWLALTGVRVEIVQRRFGHSDIATTLRYMKAAEDLNADGVGLPFPPLPFGQRIGQESAVQSRKQAPTVGLECSLHASESTRSREVAELADGEGGDASTSDPVSGASGQGIGHGNGVEGALARALEFAATAGQWEVVAQITKELEARRLASRG